MRTKNRLIETLATLAATLALFGAACEGSSAIALAPDAATTTYATGGSVATSQAADPPPIPDAAVVQAQARPDAGPIVADAAPPVVDSMQMEDGPIVLGSCGTGMQEVLATGVASCVPIPGFVAPDAGPEVHMGPPYGRCGVGYLDPPAIPTATGCVSCFEGVCRTSTCGNGILEVAELCDCGTDQANLPAGCEAVNGDDLGDGKGCTTDCLRMEVTSAP